MITFLLSCLRSSQISDPMIIILFFFITKERKKDFFLKKIKLNEIKSKMNKISFYLYTIRLPIISFFLWYDYDDDNDDYDYMCPKFWMFFVCPYRQRRQEIPNANKRLITNFFFWFFEEFFLLRILLPLLSLKWTVAKRRNVNC